MEESLYESPVLRRFVGIDLNTAPAPAPEETTILRFRHLLEKQQLGEAMLRVVNLHLDRQGVLIM